MLQGAVFFQVDMAAKESIPSIWADPTVAFAASTEKLKPKMMLMLVQDLYGSADCSIGLGIGYEMRKYDFPQVVVAVVMLLQRRAMES